MKGKEKMNIDKIVQVVTKGVETTRTFLVDNAPIIFGIKAGIGIISTSVLASRATAKSVKVIEEKEMQTGLILNKKEKFKLCAPYYIPAALEGVASIASCGASIGLFIKKTNKQADIILAYNELFERAKKEVVSEFTKNVVEEGTKNLQKPKEDNTDEKPTPILPQKNYILREDEVLCLEPYTNQLFVADRNKLDYIANQIQALHLKNAASDLPTKYNDILYSLDLPQSQILGEHFGWYFDEDKTIDMFFDSCLLKDGTPVKTVSFSPHPYII